MNVFSDFQFGFRKGRSTEQLLSVAVNSWYRARDSGLVTAIVFIDLSKAFDRVQHLIRNYCCTFIVQDFLAPLYTGLPVISPRGGNMSSHSVTAHHTWMFPVEFCKAVFSVQHSLI